MTSIERELEILREYQRRMEGSCHAGTATSQQIIIHQYTLHVLAAEERLADAETKTLTAIFEFNRVMKERDNAQREIKAYQDAFNKQKKVIDAAARVINGTYALWGSAGGSPECPHGYNVAIPCRTCDLDLLKSALKTQNYDQAH